MTRYYLDACIWIDYFENREDRFRPLGDWAIRLINKIIEEEGFIVISDHLTKELRKKYSEIEVSKIIGIVPEHLLVVIHCSKEQLGESFEIARIHNIPPMDAVHAILARDSNSILVTRDKHFYEVYTETEIRSPEELI